MFSIAMKSLSAFLQACEKVIPWRSQMALTAMISGGVIGKDARIRKEPFLRCLYMTRSLCPEKSNLAFEGRENCPRRFVTLLPRPSTL